MFEIPVGARHLLIQETDATSHNLGKYVTSRNIFSQNIFFCCLFLSLTMCLCICLPIILPHHIPPLSMLN